MILWTWVFVTLIKKRYKNLPWEALIDVFIDTGICPPHTGIITKTKSKTEINRNFSINKKWTEMGKPTETKLI